MIFVGACYVSNRLARNHLLGSGRGYNSIVMERAGFLAIFVLLLVASDVSHASLFWKLRKLVDSAPQVNENGAAPVSPLPAPVSPNKTSDPLPVNRASKESDSPAPDNLSSKVDPKGSYNSGSNHSGSAGSPTVTETDKKKNSESKEKDKTETNPQSPSTENCSGIPNKCRDLGNLVACIQSIPTESGEVVILVQNEGDSTLKVNMTGDNVSKKLEIPKHQTDRINISLASGKSTKLTFKAGSGECVLHTSPPISEGNFILRLPPFDQLATPINGAYFLILAVLIFGGAWACCKFKKRRQHGGVPYQELEMGVPESGLGSNVETAEGWDQGWDDDWDEENAVKSPGGHHVGSISANGLTARSSNKDGWENDWDD